MLAALAALVWVPLNAGQSSHILQILSKALNDINETPNNSETKVGFTMQWLCRVEKK